MTTRTATTQYAYRLAAFESRHGLNGRRPGDTTVVPGIWARLVLYWGTDLD